MSRYKKNQLYLPKVKFKGKPTMIINEIKRKGTYLKRKVRYNNICQHGKDLSYIAIKFKFDI